MKKKWYKRIFAGILALALTATSFSGDIENLVRAEDTYEQMVNGWVKQTIASASDYTSLDNLKFKLQNPTESAVTVNTTISVKYDDTDLAVSASPSIPIDANGEYEYTLTGLSAISLANGESATVTLTVDNTNVNICKSSGNYFSISTNSGDNGVYDIDIGKTEITLLSGQEYNFTPVINVAAYQNRPITVPGTSEKNLVDIADNGDGSYKITPKAGAKDDDSITLTAPNGSWEKLIIHLKQVEITPSSGVYTGKEQKPDIKLNGSVLANVPWSPYAPKDAGTYVGTVNVNGSDMYVEYVVSPLNLASASIDITNLVINNATSAVTGTIQFTNSDGSTYDVEVNKGKGIDVSASYKSLVGSSRRYDVTISGSGNFTGSTTTYKDQPIDDQNQIDITSNLSVVVDDSDCEYTGNEVYPTLTIKYDDYMSPLTKGEPTAKGIPYSMGVGGKNVVYVNYANNINAGDAQFAITGAEENGYTTNIQGEYFIRSISLSDCDITCTPASLEVGYTGTAVKLEKIEIKKSGSSTVFTEGVDYDVNYTNNVNIGKKACATIVPRDLNLEGAPQPIYFTIRGSLDDATVLINNSASYATNYTGSDIEPSIKMYFGTNTAANRLTPGSDYIVSYANNTDAGEADIIITGKGKYAGQERTVHFTIKPIPLPNTLNVKLASTRTYTGNPITLSTSEFGFGSSLTDISTDNYDNVNVVYTNNRDAGTATITVNGKKNYTGTASATFEINPVDITKAAGVTMAVTPTSVTYTGSALTPTATISLNDVELPASDFNTPKYENNIKVGTAYVTLTGTGKNVKGSMRMPFNIVARSLTDCTFTLGGASVRPTATPGVFESDYKTEYTGQSINASLSVKDNGKTVPITDYYKDTPTSRSTFVFREGDPDGMSTKTTHPEAAVLTKKNYYTIKGEGPYVGSSIQIYFTVEPRDIKSDGITFVLDEDKLAKGDTDNMFKSVTDTHPGKIASSETLKKGEEYKVEIPADGKKAGTHIATIKGIGNYTGEKQIEYTIGSSLDNLEIALYPASDAATKYPADPSTGIIQTDYLGANPAVKVFLKDGTVAKASDYKVTFSDTVNFNADDVVRTVTVEAIDGSLSFYGDKTVSYVINKVNLATLQAQGVLKLVSDKGDDSVGNTVTVEYDEKAHLIKDFHLYRLDKENGTSIGELTASDVKYNQNQLGPGVQDITLEAEGINTNYEGKAFFNLKLVEKTINETNFTITLPPATSPVYTYTGNPIEPTITIKDKATGKVLEKDKDYTVEYANNVEPGSSATYTIKGKGNYDGTVNGTFSVNQISVKDFVVDFESSGRYPYTGSPIEPAYTVSYKGVVLEEGKDYTATFDKNVNPTKKAELRISAKDTKYTGILEPFYFTIVGDLGASEVEPKALNSSYTISTSEDIDAVLSKIGLKGDFVKFTPTYVSPSGVKEPSFFLKYGEDYTVRNVDVSLGTKRIVLQAVPNGRFTGSITLPDTLFQGKFEEAKIVDSTNKKTEYYTGATINHADKISVTWNDIVIDESNYQFTNVAQLSQIGSGKYNYTIKPRTTSVLWEDTSVPSLSDSWYINYNLNTMTAELDGFDTERDPSGKESYILEYDDSRTSDDIKDAVKAAIKLKMTASGDTVDNIQEGDNYVITYNPVNPKTPGIVRVTLSKAPSDSSFTTGSTTVTFKIVGVELKSAKVVDLKVGGENVGATTCEYTGAEVVPVVEVYDTHNNLVSDSNYNLSYYDKDGNRVGSIVDANVESDPDDYYYVVAEGKAGYSGVTPNSAECRFKVKPYDITDKFRSGLSPTKGDISATADDTVTYTGEEVKPDVKVNYHTSATGTRALVEGVDYTISYDKNVAVSSLTDTPANTTKAYFTIVGKGNYKGQATKNFVINPAEIKNITLTKNTSPYTGSPIDITHYLKVADESGENELLYGTDYTVTPTTKTEKGTYDIKIIGKGNYTGETKFDKDGNPLTFTITARRFEDTYIDVKIDGSNTIASSSTDAYIVTDYICQTFPATDPEIKVYDTGIGAAPGKLLTEGVDYEIVGWYNTDKSGDGSIHNETKSPYVEIKAKDGSQYEGTKKVYFSIGKDLRNGYIDYTRVDYTYDGQVHKPTGIKVYDGVSATPVSAANGGYDINYPADMVNAGTKSISVTGKKNYFGTLSTDSSKNPIEYAINPRNIQVNRSKMQITLDLPQDADGNYYAYWTGSEIKPNVTVKDTELFSGRGYTLQQGLDKDYTVEYLYNTDITLDGYPLAQATIVPHNNYTDEGDVGVVKATFKIIPIEVNPGNIDIQWTDFTTGVGNDVVDWVDENTVVVPEYKVIYKADDGTATDLEKDIDYYLSFGYRNAAGDYVTSDDPGFKWYAGPMDLIATGAGNYHGEVKKTYAVRADLSGIDESVDIIGGDEALFTGDIPVLNNLQIKYASELPLLLPTSADEVSNNAHEVVWENENFRMTFTCPGGDYHYGHLELKSVGSRYYTGTFDFDFIAEGNVNDINVVDFVNEYDYTGAPVNVDYKLKTTGGTYVSNAISTVDYLDSSKNPIAAPIERGTYWARITIELDGNSKYEDHQFKIDAGDLDTARVEYTEEWTYTRSQIKPPIQVYDVNGHLLTEGTDYVVEYGTNIMPTTYPTPVENRTGIITIKGKEGSNYEGSEKTVKFAINLASPGVEHPVYGVRVTDETSDSVKLNWNRNAAVEKWVIEYTDNPGAGIVVPKKIEASNADNFKTITGLLADTPYQFEIYSMMGSVEGEHVKVNGSTTPEKMSTITVAPSGSNQVKITWTPVEGVSGYEIVRTDSPLNNYRLVVSLPSKNNPDSWINSNLYSGRTYYYKVRTYRVDSDRVVHYGGWSEPVQITVP